MLRVLAGLLFIATTSSLLYGADKLDAERTAPQPSREAEPVDFSRIESPIVIKGDEISAYRDPAGHYHNGVFRVFHTLCRKEDDGHYYWYLAVIKSRDLVRWTHPRILTPRDRKLNFSSPGNVIRYQGKWMICFQSYPTPNEEIFGNATARIWMMTSDDLETWSRPKLLRVKGPDVPVEKMGRMIDPYLVEDITEPGKWWCFYKQNGVSMSWTRDFENWTFFGRADCGENVCVLTDAKGYTVFHSPRNGIGVKRSKDLQQFEDVGHLTLGQKDWPWSQFRLTAAQVLDLRDEPRVGKYIMFFHGELRRHRAHADATLGLAWSDDLVHWQWGGKTSDSATSSGPK